MISDQMTHGIQSKVSMSSYSKYQDQITCIRRDSVIMTLRDGQTGEIQEERSIQKEDYVG